MPFLALLRGPNLILLAVVALISAGTATYVAREVYTGDIAELKLAHAQALLDGAAEAAATQKAMDEAGMNAVGNYVEVKLDIVMQTATIVKEIPYYVQDTSTCVTVGLIRVLDAAAVGADPADLALSPGEFNESCAGIGARALAGSIVENYGRARENAAQLAGLQAYVHDIATRLNTRPAVIQ